MATRMTEAEENTETLVRLLSRPEPIEMTAALGAHLAELYVTPRRAYHHLGHIVDVLDWFDWVADHEDWRAPREVATAILFHDAIYVAGARDNEARSAALARQAILEHGDLSGVDAARVTQLIELTARHGKLGLEELEDDEEARRFLDCDMAILGASPQRYQQYVGEIAEEYRAVPAEAYRAGRRAFVQGLLDKPRIYLSELFFLELEEAARENLRGEMT